MYGNEFYEYHLFSTLNIFNVVCSNDIYGELSRFVSLISFERGDFIDPFHSSQISFFGWPYGNFSVQNFRRPKLSQRGTFAVWNFRRTEISPYEYLVICFSKTKT